MNVLKNFITTSALDWTNKEIENGNSIAGFILRHMAQENKLRDAQQEALNVYLWLKCAANNQTILDIFEQCYSDREGSSLRTLLFDLSEEMQSDNLKRYAKTAKDEDLRKFFVDFI